MGWKIVLRKQTSVDEKSVRKPRENVPPVVGFAWASSDQRVVYMLFNTVVVRELGLVPGDTVDLFTDRGRVAVVKAKKDKGEFRVYAHGANATRLKTTVTRFYKELATKGDMVGLKFLARLEEEFQPPPDAAGKDRKVCKAMVFSPRPRKVAQAVEAVSVPKRGRGRPRKVKGEPMALSAPEIA
jgi:hypothetical protein